MNNKNESSVPKGFKEIPVNKKGAYSMTYVQFFINLMVSTIIGMFIVIALLDMSVNILPNNYLFLAIIIGIIVINIFFLIAKVITIRSLKYAMSSSMLYEEYKFIIKNILTPKFQVINYITISQTLFGRLFGVFYITIDYGFQSNENGYSDEYCVEYLTEETAKQLKIQLLKSKGKSINISP